MTLALTSHPLRQRLNNEVHARPSLPLHAPHAITFLALLHKGADSAAEEDHLHRLCDALGALRCPIIDGDHWVLEHGDLRIKWERHNEFSGYTFYRRLDAAQSEQASRHDAAVRPQQLLPKDWLDGLPGELLVATHVAYTPGEPGDIEQRLTSLAQDDEQTVVASRVADNAATVISDFLLHEGTTRYNVIDHGLRPRQAGRIVQRLLEIETYRMMALLAFPVAKDVGRLLGRAETEVAELMQQLVTGHTHEEERELLARLTRLAAEVELSVSHTAYRFGAADAYDALVRQRIAELREERLPGFPTIDEFMARRLAPAIHTCRAIARRQNDLSGRLARKSALLRTRVDVELEGQNQELLAQMNRRAKLQLRLQETVEGLSVVAITYYASQLVNYLAKGLKPVVSGMNPEVVAAISIPIIAAVVANGLQRLRRRLAAAEGGEH